MGLDLVTVIITEQVLIVIQLVNNDVILVGARGNFAGRIPNPAGVHSRTVLP